MIEGKREEEKKGKKLDMANFVDTDKSSKFYFPFIMLMNY